jgi:hypothetical protein
MTRILIITKRRDDYNQQLHGNHPGLSTGLYNSAKFVTDMIHDGVVVPDPGLIEYVGGIQSKLVVVTDNNDIDREVTTYRPDYVIIEALWVVPEKFSVLIPLHPLVRWVVRLHSDMPFLACEGIAMDWIAEYVRFPQVTLACNAPRMLKEVRTYLGGLYGWTNQQALSRVVYLPNYYPMDDAKDAKVPDPHDPWLHVGCFGAIRPLKNQLSQALASIEFADSLGKKLMFHVNAGRIEMKGDPILNNLKGLFQHEYDRGHRLVNHTWCPREEFLDVCRYMDLGLQVSLSETFNIVSADMIHEGIPIVVSAEVPWASRMFLADPNSVEDMVSKMHHAYYSARLNVWLNRRKLVKYVNKTESIWNNYFKDPKNGAL